MPRCFECRRYLYLSGGEIVETVSEEATSRKIADCQTAVRGGFDVRKRTEREQSYTPVETPSSGKRQNGKNAMDAPLETATRSYRPSLPARNPAPSSHHCVRK